MPVKVIDKRTQQEVDVPAAEAQRGVMQGDYILPESRVKITKGGKVGTVATGDLAQSISAGAKLVDDAQAEHIRIRRDESDVGSQAIGGIEAAAAGATLGASTWAEAALGADPERMRARREGLGGIGDALEVGGALAPMLLTGGGSAAAGAARAGLGARGLSAASNLSTRGVGRLGAAVESGLSSAIGGQGLARTLVPTAGRGMVEGFAAGVGAEIDESVLGEREITAERLLASGGYGALIGGIASPLVPGLAAAGQNLGKVASKPLRQVLGRVTGMADELGDKGLASILSNPTARQKFAAFNNLDMAEVNTIADALVKEPDLLHRYLTQASSVTEDLATSLRPVVEGWRNARKIAVTEGSGAARLRDVSRHLPSDADSLARIAEQSAKKLDDVEARLTSEMRAIADQTSSANRPYINQAITLTRQARQKIAAVANSPGRSSRNIAAVAHSEIDGLSQGLRELRTRAGKMANGFETQGTLDVIKPLHDDVRAFLSNADTFGEAGTRHAERNALMARAIQAQKDVGGSASGRLLDRTRIVDNADLLSTVRNSGRFAGATKTELFEDAIKAENDYLEWMVRNGDIDAATRSAIKEQLGAGKRMGEVFESQRDKVRKLDILERWRGMEGNRSPSLSMFSTAGPALLGAAGFGLGGPIGAMVGAAAGMATKPYTLTRKMAAILARTNGAEQSVVKSIAPLIKRIGEGASAAARGGVRAIERAAPQAGRAGADRKAAVAAARDRVTMLAANPGVLSAEIQRMTIDLDEDAPQLARAIAAKAINTVHYLASKAPTAYKPPMSKQPPIMDPVDVEKFMRRLEAADRPFEVLERLNTGTLTTEHVETLKAVHPEIYNDVQRQLFEAVAASPDDLTLSAATSLSMFWQIPIDPTLPLAAGIAMSLTPPAGSEQGGPQPRGQGGKAPELDAGLYDTNTQKIGQIA